MRTLLVAALLAAFCVGCSDSQDQVQGVETAQLAKKPSKKCASCDYYLALTPFPYAYDAKLALVDSRTYETVSFVANENGEGDLSRVDSIVRYGDFAYVELGMSLAAIDMTDPTRPYVSSVFAGNETTFWDNPQIVGEQLLVHRRHEYFCRPQEIHTFDLSDPGHPVSVGVAVLPPEPDCEED